MALQTQIRRLVLASASPARATMLSSAGLQFDVHPADVDEAAIRETLDGGIEPMAPADVAVMLAQAKATTVSEHYPDALVIGADQVLVLDGDLYAKPASIERARDQLLALRGKTHSLISAVACARSGRVEWYHEQSTQLTMRKFSNAFLGNYLAAVGDNAVASVGAYQLEGPGAQLFSTVDGDHFTVLGLPLLALLQYLRTQNILME